MNWLKGLLAAALGGASATVAQTLAGSGTVTKQTGYAAVAGAITAVLAYFTQSPLKPKF